MEGLERGLSYFFFEFESQKNPGGKFCCEVADITSYITNFESLHLLFAEKTWYIMKPLLHGGKMSEELSSDTAKGFALAGVAVLGLIGLNQLRKQVVRAWQSRNSDEKPEGTAKK
jgi:hypothetical protein